MTPKAFTLSMLARSEQERSVFPAENMAPYVTTVTEAGSSWDQYLFPGRTAIYRSEKFDVTLVVQFSADGSFLKCRVFPATLRISHCDSSGAR